LSTVQAPATASPSKQTPTLASIETAVAAAAAATINKPNYNLTQVLKEKDGEIVVERNGNKQLESKHQQSENILIKDISNEILNRNAVLNYNNLPLLNEIIIPGNTDDENTNPNTSNRRIKIVELNSNNDASAHPNNLIDEANANCSETNTPDSNDSSSNNNDDDDYFENDDNEDLSEDTETDNTTGSLSTTNSEQEGNASK